MIPTKLNKWYKVWSFPPGHQEDVQLEGERVGQAQANQAWIHGVAVDDGEQRGEDDQLKEKYSI